MARLLSVVLLLGVLAGCGFYRWEKPGAAAGEFQQDSQACQQQVQQQGQQSPNEWQSCMTGRGWRYVSSWY